MSGNKYMKQLPNAKMDDVEIANIYLADGIPDYDNSNVKRYYR